MGSDGVRLSLVLPHGRPKGLEVSEEGDRCFPAVQSTVSSVHVGGGSTLYVVDEGRTPDAEASESQGSSCCQAVWSCCSTMCDSLS